jgi:hypothetical protein
MVVTMNRLARLLRALSQRRCWAKPHFPHLTTLGRWIAALTLAITALGLFATTPSYALPEATCDLYVDNAAPTNGNGSLSQPWKTITGHLNLAPGQALCIRGNVSGAGRVYPVEKLDLATSGTAAAPVELRAYPGEHVILRSTGGGAVLRVYGDYWIVEDFIVDNNGSAASILLFDAGATHNTVRGNEFFNGVDNGIELRTQSTDNLLEDNHIHHFIRPGEEDAHCVLINPGAQRNILRWNTIHDCSGDGIQFYPPAVESDVAAFADGNQILANVFYRGTLPHAENAIDIKAAKNLTIAGNEIYGYSDGTAILLQKTSRNLLFDGNVIHDSLRGFNLHDENGGWPDGLTLRNNILYNLADYGVQIMGVRNGTFVHNTLVNVTGVSFYVAGDGLFTGSIRNNLVVNSGAAKVKAGAAFQNVTVGPNGWFSTGTDWPAAGDVNRTGSPGFENAAAHNYRLAAGSYALDKGANTSVSFDFEGDVRPSGSQPDLGADEYPLGLRLSAAIQDSALQLWWTEFDHPDLASYRITYAPAGGGASAASPIMGLSPATRSYRLTGLTNYKSYAVTVTAHDQSGAELGASNTLLVMPTDRFSFLPLVAGYQ